MSLSGRGRLPLTRTLAELEDLFKKYEKAYKKIDMEAYEKYKKEVDVKGNWAIETKIHNYNYTKRRIEHYKKHGTDLLETKKNIVYYSKDKQKIEGTKYESTAQQKPFLTKKVVEDEKIKKQRVKKVLTDEEKIQAKEARRVKKLDKKELIYLEGKLELGEKLTQAEKQQLKTIKENFVKIDEEKKKQLAKKKEEAKAKKLDAKYEKMKAYILDANKRIKKEDTQQEEEEEEEEEEKPKPSIEDIIGFKAEEVKPIKLLVVPKVVKRITLKEDLKKALIKLKEYNEDIKLHEARLKVIDKTRAKLAKQKGNKNTIDEIDKERDLHTKQLNNAITIHENMRKTIHIEDLKIYKKFIKNPDYFEEEPKEKPKKAKPIKEKITPIEDRLRIVAFEKNKELLAETLRRSGLTKIAIDAEREDILKKFLSVNKERQENILNYYANISKEFEEEKKSYIDEIAEPTNPIYNVKPAEAIPEFIQPEEDYLHEDEEDGDHEDEDEDEDEEDIFDSDDYIEFMENQPFNHRLLFNNIDSYNRNEIIKALNYLEIPYRPEDTLSAFRRDNDSNDFNMRMGNMRSNKIDVKSKENKKFVKKVNEEITQMMRVYYLLKNPNLI